MSIFDLFYEWLCVKGLRPGDLFLESRRLCRVKWPSMRNVSLILFDNHIHEWGTMPIHGIYNRVHYMHTDTCTIYVYIHIHMYLRHS